MKVDKLNLGIGYKNTISYRYEMYFGLFFSTCQIASLFLHNIEYVLTYILLQPKGILFFR